MEAAIPSIIALVLGLITLVIFYKLLSTDMKRGEEVNPYYNDGPELPDGEFI